DEAGHDRRTTDDSAESPHPQENNLFRRPAGLADGLALKEPALPTGIETGGIRPNNLGPPFPDIWSGIRRSWRGRLAKRDDARSACTRFAANTPEIRGIYRPGRPHGGPCGGSETLNPRA